MRDIVEDIVVSQSIPALLRVVFAVLAVGFAALLLVELGPALWPISIVTPFFAVIAFGGLFVLGSLLYAAVIGAAEIWRIRPGEVEIEHRLLATRQTFALQPARSDCTIVELTWTESEPSYHIRIRARPPALRSQGGALAALGGWFLSRGREKQGDNLQSPGFSSQRVAEHALSVLCGGPGSPADP